MTRAGERAAGYWYLMAAVLVFFASGCTGENQAAGDQRDFHPSVLSDIPLMEQFTASHPDHAVLKYAQADLNNDGKRDLIVIYRVSRNKNMMCVLSGEGSGIIETNSVPAPVSDQMIQFRNIDEKPPLEFILQGRKGAKVGYAIFRIEGGVLTDLFGEGMEDCC